MEPKEKDMSQAEYIAIERDFDAPLDRVWQAWTDPAALMSWFARDANVRAQRGGPYELFWEPENPERNSTIGCRLTHVEPHRWLAFTWRGPTLYDEPMNYGEPPPRPTHVTVRFEGCDADKTAVRVEHVGWGEGHRWKEARAWHERAWNNGLDNLAAMLSGRALPHPGLIGS